MTITAKPKEIRNAELGMRNDSELRIPNSELRPAPLVSSEVFSINFIRGEFLPPQVRRSLLASGLGWLAINALVMAWLLVVMVAALAQSQHFRASVTKQMIFAGTALGAAQEMDTFRQRALENTATLSGIIAVEQQRFPVGEKLASVTRTLPPRTWLTHLAGDRTGRTMTIQAAYLIHPTSPYDLPTKAWLAALKEDPGFREGLKRLEMGPSSRKRVGEAELFSFELTAQWQ